LRNQIKFADVKVRLIDSGVWACMHGSHLDHGLTALA
jgi:hypothetical protein